MSDKHPLNDIFQRYLNNECSTYEIKYLLKHFVSGSNDAVLRKMIADKLNDHSVDEHLQLQNPSLLLDETFKDRIQNIEPKTIADASKVQPFLNRSIIIKVIALLTLVVLLCAYFLRIYSIK